MNRIATVATTVLLATALPVAAIAAPAKKAKNPKPPKSGAYTVKNSNIMSAGSFKIVKKGKKVELTKLKGTWTDDVGSTCGTGNFTVTTTTTLHIVKFAGTKKVWIVGPYSKNNGDSGDKVSVKLGDGTTHKAKLAVLFGDNKSVPGQPLVKPSGNLRFLQGGCEGTFGFAKS